MSSVQFGSLEEGILPKIEDIKLGVETPVFEETDTIELILVFLLCLTLLSCFCKRICAGHTEKKSE